MKIYMIYNEASEYVIEEVRANSISDPKILNACLDDMVESGTKDEDIGIYEKVGVFMNNPKVLPVTQKCK
jgi:hypothetical protein